MGIVWTGLAWLIVTTLPAFIFRIFATLGLGYVGQFMDYHLFQVGTSGSMVKTDLEAIGYRVQLINSCLAMVGTDLIGCAVYQAPSTKAKPVRGPA